MGTISSLLCSALFLIMCSCSFASDGFSKGETEKDLKYLSKEEIFLVLMVTIRDRENVQQEILALETRLGIIIIEKQRIEVLAYEIQHAISIQDAERYKEALQAIDQVADMYYDLRQEIYQLELDPLMEAFFAFENIFQDAEELLYFLEDELDYYLIGA